jgi:hypothetical protein
MRAQPDLRQRNARAKVTHAPEVKVLGHVDLLEDSHEALLLARLVDLVARRYSKHFRLLAVIHIVAAEKRDGRSLGDEYHVPTRSEPHKAYRS